MEVPASSVWPHIGQMGPAAGEGASRVGEGLFRFFMVTGRISKSPAPISSDPLASPAPKLFPCALSASRRIISGTCSSVSNVLPVIGDSILALLSAALKNLKTWSTRLYDLPDGLALTPLMPLSGMVRSFSVDNRTPSKRIRRGSSFFNSSWAIGRISLAEEMYLGIDFARVLSTHIVSHRPSTHAVQCMKSNSLSYVCSYVIIEKDQMFFSSTEGAK